MHPTIVLAITERVKINIGKRGAKHRGLVLVRIFMMELDAVVFCLFQIHTNSGNYMHAETVAEQGIGLQMKLPARNSNRPTRDDQLNNK